MGLFERHEIQALYEPFPLEYHSIREGNKVDKEGKKIQWFTYLDRPAIQRRLDELFPGEWSLDHIETRRYDKFLAVTLGLSIRGVQRVFNGGQAPRAFGGAIDQDTEKGAYTEAFRRVASTWGLGLYLYEGVRIVTENYKTKNGDNWTTDWKKKDAVERDAWKQFEAWYSRNFGSQNAQSGTNSSDTQKQDTTPTSAQNGAKNAEWNAGAVKHLCDEHGLSTDQLKCALNIREKFSEWTSGYEAADKAAIAFKQTLELDFMS